MNASAALDWLFSTQFFGIKLGLENTRKLLTAAGADRPDATVVHVAGTNGKGSTCAMIEALARAKGYKTGLFTSPHLVEFAERIRVNGEMIPRDTLAAEISFMKNLAEGWEQPPTFFELALAVALRHFISNGADFIILETGLGGRLDATNALRKDISVLAPIGLDHQQYLGNTLAEIAGEKAAIIAPGKPVVTAVQEPEAMAVIEWTARERLSPLTVARANSGTPRPSLPGPHQIENAALALETMKQLNALPESALIERALKSVQWPGRFERIGTPTKGGPGLCRGRGQADSGHDSRFPGNCGRMAPGALFIPAHHACGRHGRPAEKPRIRTCFHSFFPLRRAPQSSGIPAACPGRRVSLPARRLESPAPPHGKAHYLPVNRTYLRL